MTWIQGTMVGFDTETTGVHTSSDRIVTAAIITRSGAGTPGQATTQRTWLINPGVEIPQGAIDVHGITNEKAQSEGMDPAVALDEIAEVLAEALLDGFPLVAFNASFDLHIIESELRRHGLPTLVERIGGTEPAHVRPVVDPLVLDRHLDRYRKGPRKLIALCEIYGVDVVADDLHAADADVIATLDLVLAMAAKYPALGEVALSDLHDQQIAAHRAWAENFRAWLTSKGKTDDLPNVEWPLPSS